MQNEGRTKIDISHLDSQHKAVGYSHLKTNTFFIVPNCDHLNTYINLEFKFGIIDDWLGVKKKQNNNKLFTVIKLQSVWFNLLTPLRDPNQILRGPELDYLVSCYDQIDTCCIH